MSRKREEKYQKPPHPPPHPFLPSNPPPYSQTLICLRKSLCNFMVFGIWSGRKPLKTDYTTLSNEEKTRGEIDFFIFPLYFFYEGRIIH